MSKLTPDIVKSIATRVLFTKEEVANGTPVRMISPKCPQRCLRFSRLGVPNLLNISNGSRPCLGEQLREGRSPLIRRAGATGDRKSVV